MLSSTHTTNQSKRLLQELEAGTLTPQSLELLLTSGIDENILDPFQIIERFVKFSRLELLKAFFNIVNQNDKITIDSYKILNEKDFLGYSLMHHAIMNADIEMVRYLIAYKGDIHIKDDTDKTAMHLAGNDDHGRASFTSDYKKGNQANLIRYLLNELKMDIDECDNMGRTSLMDAISRSKMYKAKLLIDLGSDIELKDNNGMGILDIANEADEEMGMSMVEIIKEHIS